MKKITLLLLFISTFCCAQVQNVTFTSSPTAFNEDDQITITIS